MITIQSIASAVANCKQPPLAFKNKKIKKTMKYGNVKIGFCESEHFTLEEKLLYYKVVRNRYLLMGSLYWDCLLKMPANSQNFAKFVCIIMIGLQDEKQNLVATEFNTYSDYALSLSEFLSPD